MDEIIQEDFQACIDSEVIIENDQEAFQHSEVIIMENQLCKDYEINNVVMLEESMDNEYKNSNLGLCLVCGDRGSGFHYSAYTCEGCKGFFKRTVQRGMTYNCRDVGMCFINKTTRNHCQACRYKRCLTVGMRIEAVREDRMPGARHRMKRYNVDNEVLNCDSTHLEELIVQIVDAHPDLMPDSDLLNEQSEECTNQSNKLKINDLMRLGYLELKLIIDWARKVPGFGDLLLEDQMALLKSSFMELNVLRLAYRSLLCEKAIFFTEKMKVPLEMCEEDFGWGHDFIKCTLEFILRLKYTDIDNVEFAILCAVVLTYPDANGIQNKVQVASLQNKLLDCMRYYACTQHAKEPRRCGRLLLRLPALRTLSARAAEMFLNLSLENENGVGSLVFNLIDES